MVDFRQEFVRDALAREALLDRAYGPSRFDKPSERLRRGRLPAAGLSFVAVERGKVIGAVRLWNVAVGASRGLLLGPLAVDPDFRSRGIGRRLMQEALAAAQRRGHEWVLLVGDAAYYRQFGFAAVSDAVRLPGNPDPDRLLGLDLELGALSGLSGDVGAPPVTRPASRRGSLRPAGDLVSRAA